MDKKQNAPSLSNEDTFLQYCLQTLTPLINFPMFSDDLEKVKSQSAPCNCSKSGCLKLYCECFAKGKYCLGCGCINCFNTPEHESIRNKALNMMLQRKSKALAADNKKVKGCTCSKTGCKKKYCRCLIGGIKCGEACKCKGCQN